MRMRSAETQGDEVRRCSLIILKKIKNPMLHKTASDLRGEASQVSYEIRDLHVLDEFTHQSTHQKKIDTTPTIDVRTFFC